MEKLRLLLLEDMISDAELIIRTLERSGMEFQAVLVQNAMEFINALDEQDFDVILADNTLPQFSANEALTIITSRRIDVPFILVTGSISEEYAVEMMKLGTWDYILKDRLQRLPNAVLSAYHKYTLAADNNKIMAEVIANEALLKEASRLARFGSWETDMVSNKERWSDEQFRMLDYDPAVVKPSIRLFLERVHPEDLNMVNDELDRAYNFTERRKFDCRIVKRDGSVRYILVEMKATTDENERLLRVNGFMQDITSAKEAEAKERKITADLIQRNKDLEQFAYIISHNLRGPVANIVGISDALFDKGMSDDEKESFMEALSTSVRKLDNTIIDLNSIIQVKHHINENKEWVGFAQVVEEVTSGYGKILSDKGINIKCDFAGLAGMSTLKTYMHSIFYNLISNSIKFRHAERTPEIEIRSYFENDKIFITFRDNGIGIDLARRSEHVFGLYKRFHPDYAEGKGMGLFMVKTQVETLGGKIGIKSTMHEGTEFTIEFEK